MKVSRSGTRGSRTGIDRLERPVNGLAVQLSSPSDLPSWRGTPRSGIDDCPPARLRRNLRGILKLIEKIE